MKQLKVRGC